MVDKEIGELRRIMTNDAVFLEEIAGEELDAKAGDLLRIQTNLLGAFHAIAARDFGRDGLTIGDDVVDEILADVILDGADMFAESVVGSFAGLGHKISDVDARSFRASDGLGDFRNQQIWKDAGIERAGAHENKVSVVDGVDSSGKRTDTARNEFEFADRCRTAGNVGFARNALASGERGDKMNVGDRGRKDAATNGQDFRGDPNGFGEVSGDVSEGGEEEIAEIVAAEAASRLEAILEETAEEGFVFGKRDHAVANVAGRKDAIFAAQASGAAAVVGDGDDGGEIGDGAGQGRFLVAAPDDVILQAAQQSGESSAPTKGDNTEGARGPLRLARFCHERFKCRKETAHRARQ